jgi:hypothetical protein
MERSGWVQAKAARMLGLTSRQVGYALKKHGVEIKHFWSRGNLSVARPTSAKRACLSELRHVVGGPTVVALPVAANSRLKSGR